MIYGKKPVMSAALERQALNAVTMFTKSQQWKKWGLHKIREQGSALMLEGPPGCGKTVIAEWLALKVLKSGFREVTFADFGSGDPGGSALGLRNIFVEGKENNWCTLYFNECDAILVDRETLGPDAKWMVEVIDELLIQTEKYKGFIVFATNRPDCLDPALWRRILRRIHVGPPEQPERARLWKVKVPDEYPWHPNSKEIEKLATLQLTGAEIENAIINYSSDIIRLDRRPTFNGMVEAARQEMEVARATS